MPLTDQMIGIAPYVRTFSWVTIYYKYHAWDRETCILCKFVRNEKDIRIYVSPDIFSATEMSYVSTGYLHAGKCLLCIELHKIALD